MDLRSRIHNLINLGGPAETVKGFFRFVYWQSGLRSARYSLGYKLNGSPIVRTVDDTTASFVVSSPNEYARASTIHGERPVVTDVLRTLNSSDVFYDVGANVGTYTCFAGQVVDDQNVIAFEPHPANIERLRENASLNNIQADVRPIALSNEQSTTELAISGENDQAGVGTHSLSTGEDERTLEIETIEGDLLIEEGEIPPPSVIKIDVEGAEQLVLEGLTSTLENNQCHTIYCEVHPDRIADFGGSEQELRALLDERGYSLQVIEDRSPEYFLKAQRDDE